MSTRALIYKAIRRNPTVRRFGIPIYRTYADLRAITYPHRPVLVNAIPKAGTHLLTALLAHLPGTIHSGRHHELDQFELPVAWSQTGHYDWLAVKHALRSIRGGQYFTGHFPAERQLLAILAELDITPIFIIRDPRDIVVSAVHYIVSHPHHPLRPRYLRECPSMEDKIMATIEGRPPLRTERGWRSIGQELARYIEWYRASGAHVSRFEHLVGGPYGSQPHLQRAEVSAIASFVGRPLSPQRTDKVVARMSSPRSATFRKGRIGDWRRHFTKQHCEAFKTHAGAYLLELGYESSSEW